MSTEICHFGCKKPAIYLSRNRPCCCKHFVQCEFVRNKNSLSRKGQPSARKGGTLPDKHKANISRAMMGHENYVSPQMEVLRRKKISATMKTNPNAGGYRYGSGRGKKGKYKGYWCDSTYELVFVIFHIDHNIPFERNWEKFSYEYEGIRRNWIPDFRMKDGSFIEIKGYETEQFKAKCLCFTKPLKILRRTDMSEMFDYVESKYGKDLPSLYD